MSAKTRGWGPGWPTARASDQRQLSYITGSVHKDIHALASMLCRETVRRGYRIRRDWSWGYASRPIAGTTIPSNHSWGLAVDINAPKNPMRNPLTTDMPPWMPTLWESYGWRWGGRYTGTPDAMHYEFMGSPADARVLTARAARTFGDAVEEDDMQAVVKGIQDAIRAAGGNPGPSDGMWGPRTQAALATMLAKGGVRGPKGDPGPRGLPGEQGVRGPNGVRGPAGPAPDLSDLVVPLQVRSK